MAIQLYNSLTRKKEAFIPLDPPRVAMYTCGVTVYDESHIGHARSLYTFDVIRRYLAYKGYEVSFVRNITDIDDKIIRRATQLKTDWKELVARYIGRYYEDLDALGIAKGDHEPRATENIPDMIEYIKALVDKGYVYATPSGVYFSVRKFKAYGKLSGQSIEQMLTGVRKEPDETKEDPLDFALWKTSKPGEPFWASPWGNGRPGWHIECSVMSAKFLKVKTLDIHAGGRDLVFPHHENEIAQAEALTGELFAKYWIHHGLLTINGQKMAKSSGNFITIKGFLDKYRDPNLLKLFFLSAHYSHPIDYTEEKINEAGQALERITILKQAAERKSAGPAPGKTESAKEVADIKDEFTAAMDDDFNTPRALAAVFDLVNSANKHIDNPSFLNGALGLLSELTGLLGVDIDKAAALGELSVDTAGLIEQRSIARKNGDYKEADRIRKELEQAGIVIEDTKEGTVWRKKH